TAPAARHSITGECDPGAAPDHRRARPRHDTRPPESATPARHPTTGESDPRRPHPPLSERSATKRTQTAPAPAPRAHHSPPCRRTTPTPPTPAPPRAPPPPDRAPPPRPPTTGECDPGATPDHRRARPAEPPPVVERAQRDETPRTMPGISPGRRSPV